MRFKYARTISPHVVLPAAKAACVALMVASSGAKSCWAASLPATSNASATEIERFFIFAEYYSHKKAQNLQNVFCVLLCLFVAISLFSTLICQNARSSNICTVAAGARVQRASPDDLHRWRFHQNAHSKARLRRNAGPGTR